MAKIVQHITVEVSKPNFFQAIVAKQFDSDSRFLKATLINGSETIKVAPTSTVTINARRNDGTEKPFVGVVNDDGTVTVPLTYWILELEGKVECDISIIDEENSKLTSTKFIVDVERASCADPDVTDSSNYDILILQGRNIVGSVNGKTGDVDIGAADVGAVSVDDFSSAISEANKNIESKSDKSHNHDDVYMKSAPIKDYVVEQGTYGAWTYRKWASGMAECWCKKNWDITEISEYGNIFVSPELTDLPDLPITMVDTPCVSMSLENSKVSSFILSGTPHTVSKLGSIYIGTFIPNSTSYSITIHFTVVSRWK